MSDREIDEILEEIKRHAQQENNISQEPAFSADENEKKGQLVDDVMKIVGDDDEIKTEKPETFKTPIEETSDKTVSFSLPEEELPKEAEKAIEEPKISEDKTVVFSLPEEEEALPEEEEEVQGDVVFSIPEEAEEMPETEEELPLSLTDESEEAPVEEAEDNNGAVNLMSMTNETTPFVSEDEEIENNPKSKKKALIIVLVILILAAIGVGVYFGFFYNKSPEENKIVSLISSISEEETTKPAEEPVSGPTNPLTGEAGYNKEAIGKRPVAVVVENEYSTASVKPQWGINEADIVLEGESEFSTRLLLFWADYTNMPAQIGPARSARPPFIRFSQLFDCVFLHAGLSKTKGNYIGADTVFQTDNVDHINLLTYSEDGVYFGRDKSRTSTIEHTGYLNGTNVPQLLAKANINTDINSAKFSELQFNTTPQKLSENTATSVRFIWSNACPKKGDFYYDESLETYSTTDFDSDYGKANLEFENLIFLFDTTEYVVKENYKHGKSETYCNYKLYGGTGTILSHGTYIDITWGVENSKLWMKDDDGNEVKLNPGKSYIGYGSANHGGSLTINSDNAE